MRLSTLDALRRHIYVPLVPDTIPCAVLTAARSQNFHSANAATIQKNGLPSRQSVKIKNTYIKIILLGGLPIASNSQAADRGTLM